MEVLFDLSKVQFTNESDIVDPGLTIFNPIFSHVQTLNGDDQLIGNTSIIGDFGFKAIAEAEAKGIDFITESFDISTLIDEARIDGNGFKNRGIISTNQGQDIVQGWVTANLSTTVEAVASAVAVAKNFSAISIADVLVEIEFIATADGIDNFRGRINTNSGNDSIGSEITGSITAIATATVNSSAIVEAIATMPMSQELVAFSDAIASSLANATIISRGINNRQGKITTGLGNDTINSLANTQTIAMTDGLDTLFAEASEGNIALALGVADAIAEATEQAIGIYNLGGYINTGEGDDTIITKVNDGDSSFGIFGGQIYTGEGQDSVIAGKFGGDVEIYTGKGNDYVEGFGKASLFGGQGFDKLSLERYNYDDFNSINIVGKNVYFSLEGSRLRANSFEQFIFENGETYTRENLPFLGSNGKDLFQGRTTDDIINARAGDDVVYGRAGSDRIFGRQGNDILHGGNDNDIINGGHDDDILFGNRGRDVLNGGLGRDILKGGLGKDRFIISGVSAERDLILDYENGVDEIQLIRGLTFEELTVNQIGANTEIRDIKTHETFAILVGTNALDIDISDFV